MKKRGKKDRIKLKVRKNKKLKKTNELKHQLKKQTTTTNLHNNQRNFHPNNKNLTQQKTPSKHIIDHKNNLPKKKQYNIKYRKYKK